MYSSYLRFVSQIYYKCTLSIETLGTDLINFTLNDSVETTDVASPERKQNINIFLSYNEIISYVTISTRGFIESLFFIALRLFQPLVEQDLRHERTIE